MREEIFKLKKYLDDYDQLDSNQLGAALVSALDLSPYMVLVHIVGLMEFEQRMGKCLPALDAALDNARRAHDEMRAR